MNLHLKRFITGIMFFLIFVFCFILARFWREFIKDNPQIFNPIGVFILVLVYLFLFIVFIYALGIIIEMFFSKKEDVIEE